jgi:4-amino-4-deoxy-L-arabinose transferase-like glycosyltransferase
MADQGEGAVPVGRIPTWARRTILIVLSLAFFAVGMHQADRDAPTVDEGVDVSSGVAALVRHDLRMVPEHPVLPKALAALPALLAHPIVPDTQAWRDGDWFDWSDDFISANAEAGRLDDILLWSRGVLLLETIAAGGLLYLVTKRFFGPDGGLLAAVCWLTTPYVVGLGHFAMIDIPFVLVTLAFCLLLARWVDDPSTGRIVALGLVLGAALATRHTALVLVLVAVGVMVHHLRKQPREAATAVGVAGLTSLLALWLIYRGLAPGGSSAEVQASFNGLIDGAAGGPAKLVGALPLPLEWRAGFAYLDLTSTERPASLLGQSWDGGRWWFFPVSAAVKLPLTLVVAIVTGWAVTAARALHRKDLLRFVVLPGLLLWLLLLAQPLNLGLRLAMPIVALSFVGLGALPTLVPSDLGTTRARLGLAGIAVVVVAQFVAMAVAVPYSLAWTPPPWTPAYRWVSDASLDAGQALYEVRDWAATHDRPYVAIDRTRGEEIGGGARNLVEADPTEVRGWVAAAVTPLMQTRRDELAWLRKYCPVGTLGGGSVLVYRFDAAPDPSPGPERPVEPCFDDAFSSDRTSG